MTKVLTVQLRPKIGKVETNLEKAAELIKKSGENPDLIVLSEFFNTGISRPAFERCAEEESSSRVKEFMGEIARAYNSFVLCGSVVEKDGDKLYNTSRLLDRNGRLIAKYRKKNLFKYFGGTENLYISPGNETVVVDTEIGKIGFSTCFDICYPLHFTELVKKGAQIVLCPSAWCTHNDKESIKNAGYMWKCWNNTRAVDNAVYVISSNMCGEVDSNLYCVGNSSVTSFCGELLACAGDEEGTASADIDLEALQEYRKIAPVKF